MMNKRYDGVHVIWIVGVFVFAKSMFWEPIAVYANDIVKARLIMDGSFAPPGDSIELQVALYPEAINATVEVRAYLVSGERNEIQVPVRAVKKENNSDKNGLFLLSNNLRVAKSSQEPTLIEGAIEENSLTKFNRTLVVPFGDLAIAEGEHKLGYVVRLIVDEETVDELPLRLTLLKVTGSARKQMQVRSDHSLARLERENIDATVWRQDRLEAVTAPLMRTIYYVPTAANFADVDIKGEFLRGDAEQNQEFRAGRNEFIAEPRRVIWFATNRENVKPAGTADDRFSNESVLATDKMIFGKCIVSIPIAYHSPGAIEQPGTKWLFWTEKSDPDKHFLVQEISQLSKSEFATSLGKDDILLFVHGYNNTFKSAVLRGAQLQHDCEFKGKALVFSWPSSGSRLLSLKDPFDRNGHGVEVAYFHDEQLAQRSHDFLAELLDQLLNRQEVGTGKIHVIAHSMGNRVLLKALHKLYSQKKLKDGGPRLGNVILAAADIDGATFANVRTSLLDSCARISFYFAPDDAALLLSREIHGDKPIGLGPLFDPEKIDTISAASLTSIFNQLGHVYVVQSKSMLTDIRLLINRNWEPKQRRPPLGPRIEAPDLTDCFYWTFQSER